MSVMRTTCALIVSAALWGAFVAQATPTATGESYTLAIHSDDNVYDGIMDVEKNLLRAEGVSFTFEPGSLNDYKGKKYNGGKFYEPQAEEKDFGCITDGKIPLHRRDQTVDGVKYGSSYDDRKECRLLVPMNSVMIWTWADPKMLTNVKLYTQWPDGARNDVSTLGIEVLVGDDWQLLPNSTFAFSRGQGWNTVEQYLGDGTKNRKVIFEDPDVGYLALGVKGLRITFGDQYKDLCYGCYWEIEAEGYLGYGASGIKARPTGGTVEVSGVLNPTDDANPGTLVVKYGKASEGLVHELVVTPQTPKTPAGFAFAQEILRLAPETDYIYAVEYTENAEIVSAVTNSFKTVEDYGILPGLMQAQLEGKYNKDDGLGASKNGINRTLGPLMGLKKYSADGEVFPEVVNFDGKTFRWGFQTTYLYQGYIWLEGGVEYGFYTRQDDRGRIVIDGNQILESAAWDKSAEGTYTPDGTGWHFIDIRSGNDSGAAGAGADNNVGFGMKRVGESNYQVMLDRGDGSLFCCVKGEAVPRPMQIELCAKDGQDVQVVMDVDIDGEYAIYPLYSADYKTWTTNAAPVVENDHGTFAVTVPDGTTYVRFMAVLNGDPEAVRYSASIYLPEVQEFGAAPVALVNSAAATVDGALVNLSVVHIGDGATGWTAKLLCGFESTDEFELVLGSGTGPARLDLHAAGMLQSMSYKCKVVVENNLSQSGEAGSFEVTTHRLVELEGLHQAGLLQGKYKITNKNVAPNFDVPIADMDVANVDTTLGMLMAKPGMQGDENTRPTVQDAISKAWNWDKTYSAYYYEGLIYLECGKTIYVESKFDDGVAIFIDDNLIFNEYLIKSKSGYDSADNYDVGSYTPTYTGWHKFRSCIWDWSGGKEIMHGLAAAQWTCDPSAVTVSPAGVVSAIPEKAENPTLWHEFYDDGTGSFLRREATNDGRSVSVASMAITAAGELTATLAFAGGDGQSANSLHVVYGDNYGGEGVWDHDVNLGSVAGDAASFNYGPLAGVGESVKYVRFYLERNQHEGRSWSKTIFCVDRYSPIFAGGLEVSGLSSGDTLTVNGELAALGGSVCDVTLELSRTGDFSDVVSVSVGNYNDSAAFEKTLHNADTSAPDYIKPGETLYIRAKAVNAQGKAGYTPATVVRPKGAMVIGDISLTKDLKDFTITAKIVDAGMGVAGSEPKVQLWLEGVLIDEQEVADGGQYVYSGTREDYGNYKFKLVGVNSCATKNVTTESPEQDLELIDTGLYFWKEGVTEGCWDDPNCWTREGGDKGTFPNSTKCYARFDNIKAPTTVYVDGKYSAALINIPDRQNANLTFAGIGTPGLDNQLEVFETDNGLRFAAGMDLTLSNVYLKGNCKYNPPANSWTRVLYGSIFELNREYWWVEKNTNANLEVRGKSTLRLTDWNVRSNGGSGQVIVDDSTIEAVNSGGGLRIEKTESEDYSLDFVFMGANPQMKVDTMSIAYSHCATLTFEVPVGGFESPVITCTKGNNVLIANDGVTIPLYISKTSPALGEAMSTKLISWPNGIKPESLDFTNQVKRVADRANCYYTYGNSDALEPAQDGDLPTGLWMKRLGVGLVIAIK